MHSVVQFPTQDPGTGDPTDTKVEQLVKPITVPGYMMPGGAMLKTVTDLAYNALKKIGDWFHLSKLGFGHSESIGKLLPAAHSYLPPDNKYEVAWWNRSVRLDGSFHGLEFDKQEAESCVKLYAEKVSIGNLTLLRQFLETSMRKSRRPFSYLEAFYYLLNKEGRDVLLKQMKRFGEPRHYQLESVIKTMLGLTRKREYLIQEWSDDNLLWLK